MVLCLAFSSRGTRTIVDAGIDTLRISALLIVRTIVVAATFDNRTLHQRIATITAQASTFSSVRYSVAFGVDSAWITIQARVDAVSVDTSLTGLAFGVHPTSDRSTGNVRVSFVATLAGAHSSVISNGAHGVFSAVAWISALPVDTSFPIRALRIGRTLRRCLQNYALTFAIHIGHV